MAESKLPPDFEAQLEAATARGAERARWEPRAQAVRYEAGAGTLVVRMAAGPEVHLPVRDIEELRGGTPAELAQVALRPGGTALTCAPLDADIYLPGLIADALGLTEWWKRQRAAEAGRVSTEAKAASSRANGRRGGRPASVSGEPAPLGTVLVTVDTALGALPVRAGCEYEVGPEAPPSQRGRHAVALRYRGDRDGRLEARFTDTGRAGLVDPRTLREMELRARQPPPLFRVAEPRAVYGPEKPEA
jgi:hypothetical protein